ncbi:hypothetical protein [uncultured Microbacterium sp.]|uniref:hypothetical protein n=1 Tax=uncultured Microbacterium sp. TaxID=191216 RepID=UPI0025EA58F5|nr:hypothetical protein [uncultured Microbacterium sp.]
MAGGGDASFTVEPVNLREILSDLKAVDPKLANSLRREFRRAGDEILAAQRAALSKRPPRVGGSSKGLRLIRPRNGREPYFAFRRTYREGETRAGGVSQLRAKIAGGLRVRTVAGARRQAVEFKTSGPTSGGANMARVFEKRMFRHPVFGGSGAWAPQYGQPYFFKPVTNEMRQRMADRIQQSIDDALAPFA